MKKVSVICSTYNESDKDLVLAIDSVLNQSFKDFEFIIVCDNPNNTHLHDLLKSYADKDNRIKLLFNEKNIGLALSLNKGIQASTGELLMRMDADDICVEDRFEKELNVLGSGKYDMVWSSYYFIDEEGNMIDKEPTLLSDYQIPDILPYENLVHHPTVLMTREIFNKAGGYRNFPCAQDYDLWLRMLQKGAKMHMMEDKLLYYRVRSSSITNKKKYMQLCTLDYIRSVNNRSLKDGVDIYSYESYLTFLSKCKVGDSHYEEKFRLAQSLVADGKKLLSKHDYFKGFSLIAKGLLIHPFYRKQFFLTLQRQRIKKSLGIK